MSNAAEHSIGTLIQSLNTKAAACGCAVRAEHHTLEQTWGDHCGIAITGGTVEQRERAAQYATAYYRKHLEQRRNYSAQYGLTDNGEKVMARGVNGLANPAYCWGADKMPREDARIIGLVYWPCSD